ncbi:hypothetical protein, partial [Pseudomonas syringae group genomosp. 7]|uniref:hypothetical protein n=1 Tax=Pseudomonas syringae group genomosp. 7 TaxID=251699 RepID=UPI00376F7834
IYQTLSGTFKDPSYHPRLERCLHIRNTKFANKFEKNFYKKPPPRGKPPERGKKKRLGGQKTETREKKKTAKKKKRR